MFEVSMCVRVFFSNGVLQVGLVFVGVFWWAGGWGVGCYSLGGVMG